MRIIMPMMELRSPVPAFYNMFSSLLISFLVLLMSDFNRVSSVGTVKMSHEKRLIRDLIGNYTLRGKMGRPVESQNDTITIFYGMSLIQILDLDERNQVLTTNVWATYNWNDMYLAWNESEYGGIGVVRVDNHDIWKPDLKLYNYADVRLEERRDALCVVSSDGDVVWIPQAVFKSSCYIDIQHFPFDVQECHLKFGSWTYDGSKLDLQFQYHNVAGFEMGDYIKSNEWDIIASKQTRNVKYYECCPEPYVDLKFTLRIKRKVAFYNYILILPCVLLSSLTLVLFWLPPESPAKMQLGMNIFVAFFVLLLLLAESTPPAATSIPLIGAYYCLNMILITLSTLLSVVIVNLYFRGSGTPVPLFFKWIMLDVFAKVFCMRNTLMGKKEQEERQKERLGQVFDRQVINGNSSTTNTARLLHGGGGGGGKPDNRHYADFKYDRVGIYDMNVEENNSSTWTPLVNGRSGMGTGSDPDITERPPPPLHSGGNFPSQYVQLESEVREIRCLLKHIVDKNREAARKEFLAREWKLVALVLDRLFFFLYLLAIIVSALALFKTTMLQPENLIDSDDSSSSSSSSSDFNVTDTS